MPQGEKEAHSERFFAVVDEFACCIVYCCDMIGIYRMPQAQAIRQGDKPKKKRIRFGVDECECPDDDV